MTESADPPETTRPARSLARFYVTIVVFAVLAPLGAWSWVAWRHWWFDAAEAQRRQAEAAARLGLPVEKAVDLGGGVKLDLVLIPAGRFRTRAQIVVDGDLKTRNRWVRIARPFYMGRHEVTQDAWERVMGSNPSKFRGARNPVENVSWEDCQEFVNRLNQRSPHPLPPLPEGEGGRFRSTPLRERDAG